MNSDQPAGSERGPTQPRPDTAPTTAGVSTLELFFDLVFVFTITQLTAVVDHHPGPIAAAQAALMLVVLFWMYAGFTWLTNVTGAAGVGRRLTVLAGMAALFICSLAVPEAFGTEGLTFGIAYLALTLIHLIGFRRYGDAGGRRGIIRIAPVNIGAALLILAAGFTDSAADWLLWSLAAGIYLVALLGSRASRGFTVRSSHFAERHGLMILIVLGESLISVGVAASGQQVTGRLVVGALCGFVCIAALWWAYFVGDDEAAAERLAELDESAKSRFAIRGYDLTHVLMIAGIIGVAAGTRLGLPDLLLPAELAAGVLIAAGSALYLLGTAWFRSAFRFAPAGPRVVGAAGCLLTTFVGAGWGTGQQLAAVAAVVAAATAAPGLLHRRSRKPATG